jgi:hypothetical protein
VKSQLYLYNGEAFQALGRSRFKKDIVRIGKWIHPLTGQMIEFDAARLARLVENTEKYRQNVDKQVVPFPDGHKFGARDNMGGVTEFRVEGERLVATFEPSGQDIEEKISSGKIRSVSAYIEMPAKDSQGNVYSEAITHVAATPYPVITGQEDFVKLSAKDDAFDLFVWHVGPSVDRHPVEFDALSLSSEQETYLDAIVERTQPSRKPKSDCSDEDRIMRRVQGMDENGESATGRILRRAFGGRQGDGR